MVNQVLYQEKLKSNRTLALFLCLMLVFLVLLIWRWNTSGFGFFTGLFLFLTLTFFFYSLNFRVLEISLTSLSLTLRFGIIKWSVAVENIAECKTDEIPTLMRYGGAGVHLMMINRRYRVSLNFLEYPRIVIKLKTKTGPVCDVSFSTQKPEEWIHQIKTVIEIDCSDRLLAGGN